MVDLPTVALRTHPEAEPRLHRLTVRCRPRLRSEQHVGDAVPARLRDLIRGAIVAHAPGAADLPQAALGERRLQAGQRPSGVKGRIRLDVGAGDEPLDEAVRERQCLGEIALRGRRTVLAAAGWEAGEGGNGERDGEGAGQAAAGCSSRR